MPDEHDADEPLTPEEARALARLSHDEEPPSALEGRVIGALHDQRLLFVERASRGWARTAGVAVAALVIGVWVGPLLRHPATSPTSETAAAPRYMLLLYEDGTFQTGGAADEERRVREYGAWARSLAQKGILVAGDELASSGEALRREGRPQALGAPELGDQPDGYFVIVAPDDARAEEIASTCPHLRYGGKVIVRRIVT
jgi:hypothetical protein